MTKKVTQGHPTYAEPTPPKTFICYLHKAGVPAPELRVVACPSENELPDQILSELPTWGPFEMIDVYDDADHQLFSFSGSPRRIF